MSILVVWAYTKEEKDGTSQAQSTDLLCQEQIQLMEHKLFWKNAELLKPCGFYKATCSWIILWAQKAPYFTKSWKWELLER